MSMTPRQKAIAYLVLRGHSNDQIAAALQRKYPGLTPRTVRSECEAMKSLWPKSKLAARQRIVMYLSKDAEAL